jgi:hypothetical protein
VFEALAGKARQGLKHLTYPKKIKNVIPNVVRNLYKEIEIINDFNFITNS